MENSRKGKIIIATIAVVLVVGGAYFLIQEQRTNFKEKNLPESLVGYQKNTELVGEEAINQMKNLHQGEIIEFGITRAIVAEYQKTDGRLVIYFTSYENEEMANSNLSLMVEKISATDFVSMEKKQTDDRIYYNGTMPMGGASYLLWKDGRALYWVTIIGEKSSELRLMNSLETKMGS